jgi:hypothetical protein
VVSIELLVSGEYKKATEPAGEAQAKHGSILPAKNARRRQHAGRRARAISTCRFTLRRAAVHGARRRLEAGTRASPAPFKRNALSEIPYSTSRTAVSQRKARNRCAAMLPSVSAGATPNRAAVRSHATRGHATRDRNARATAPRNARATRDPKCARDPRSTIRTDTGSSRSD